VFAAPFASFAVGWAWSSSRWRYAATFDTGGSLVVVRPPGVESIEFDGTIGQLLAATPLAWRTVASETDGDRIIELVRRHDVIAVPRSAGPAAASGFETATRLRRAGCSILSLR
jgi:hypothetical protein